MCRDGFWKVETVVRVPGQAERRWIVEVDPDSLMEELKPDLVKALPIEQGAAKWDLRREGSIDEPVLVLVPLG